MTIIKNGEYCLSVMDDALRALKGSKEQANTSDEEQAYAITITELEKAMAYFQIHVVNAEWKEEG